MSDNDISGTYCITSYAVIISVMYTHIIYTCIYNNIIISIIYIYI